MNLDAAVRTIGYKGILDFFDSFPHDYYGPMLGRLRAGGLDTCYAALCSAHLNAHQANGTLRLAAADRLVRSIHKNLGTGWSSGKRIAARRQRTYDDWIDGWRLPVWQSLWEELNRMQPADDWLPNRFDDPLIVSLFDAICQPGEEDFPRMTEEELAEYYRSVHEEG